MPALYFTGMFEAFKRYLMAQVPLQPAGPAGPAKPVGLGARVAEREGWGSVRAAGRAMFVWHGSLLQWLQSGLPRLQGVVRPATVVTLLSLALSPLYNWLLIFRLGWGLDGAALAVDAVQVRGSSASPASFLDKRKPTSFPPRTRVCFPFLF